MRKILLGLLVLFLLISCHCNRKKDVVSAPVIHEAQEEIQPASITPTSALNEDNTSSLDEIPTQTDLKQTVSAQKITPDKSAPSEKTASVKSTILAAQNATAENNSAVETTIENETPVAAVIPLAQPVPDEPVFNKEELISTQDRMLNPYAALPPDTKTPQQAPWAYEQLKYGIYYSFIKAGTAYIRNRGLVDINGHPAYFIQTTAFSAPVIDAVFKVRDINQSWLDAETFYSYGYGQSVREGNYKRDEWLQFDYPNKQYVGEIQKKEEPRKIKEPLDIKVLDMLSALYFVRAQRLEIGHDIVFDIVNREKQYPLVVKVLKKDTVKTSAGKFNCIVVEPQLRGEGIFVAKGKSLKVWLTDDEYKMPVKMEVEVFIGSVSAELLEYKRQAPKNIL